MSGTVIFRPVPRRRRRVAAAGWLGWLAAMLRGIETRRHLAQMDERMLKDIGLTRADAVEEAGRAPWDLGPDAPVPPWILR